jgi:hypothetical protein
MHSTYIFSDKMTTIMRRKVANENQKINADLRVIGTGLPRTGTKTLQTALEILWIWSLSSHGRAI